MNTFKFRAKRKDNNEWVYGGVSISAFLGTTVAEKDDGVFIVVTERDSLTYHHRMYEVFPETLGQFTGLLDENKSEIYFGDIINAHDLEYDSNFTGVVEFGNASFLINENDFIKHYRWMDYQCRVIGNIHDIKSKL